MSNRQNWRASRKTVSQWKNGNPVFIKSLNEAKSRSSKELAEQYHFKNGGRSSTRRWFACRRQKRKEDAQTTRWLLDKIGFENFAGKIFEAMVDPDLPPRHCQRSLMKLRQKGQRVLTLKGIDGVERLKLFPILKARD
jgi:hypothetical protein